MLLVSQASRQLVILHFNDCYHVEPQSKEPVGGAARIAYLLRNNFPVPADSQVSAAQALILFSGDIFAPSLTSTITKGVHMVPVLNAFGIYASVFGNHDFDFGIEHLERMIGETKIAWLMSNVIDKRTKKPLASGKRTVLVDWPVSNCEVVRVGLIGLVESDWLATLVTITPDTVDYTDFVDAGTQLASELRAQGAELVIALTHMRLPNDQRLAQEAGHVIDLVLGGHDHFVFSERNPHNGCWVVKSGTDFQQLSRIVVDVPRAGRPAVCGLHTVDVTASVPEDPAVKELAAAAEVLVGKRLDRIIGETDVVLEARFSVLRTAETNVGNFVCDVMCHTLGTQIALLNSGTIRSNSTLGPGPIRMRDLTDMLPMEDGVVVLEVTGAVLWAALENGVSKYPVHEGRFPQVSGIKFAFDPAKPPGQRVAYVNLASPEEPILRDSQKTFTLATKEYLYKGKDGYEMLSDCRCLIEAERNLLLPTMVRHHFLMLATLNGFRTADAHVRRAFANWRKFSIIRKGKVRPEDAEAMVTPLTDKIRAKKYKVNPVVEGRIICLARN